MKEIDDIIERFKKTKYTKLDYNKRKSEYSILSYYSSEEEQAMRAALLEWIQDHFIDEHKEIGLLKQKVEFLEEMTRKSTFHPFAPEEEVKKCDVENCGEIASLKGELEGYHNLFCELSSQMINCTCQVDMEK